MLRWRLMLSVIIVAALAGLVWLDVTWPILPALWLLPIVVLLAVMATSEILELASKAGLAPEPWSIYAGNLMMIVAAWTPLALSSDMHLEANVSSGSVALAALGLTVFGVFLSEVRRFHKPGGVTANTAAGVLALVYVGGMLAILIHLRMIFGLASVLTLIVVVKMGDVGGYSVGRLFGRHKLAPSLSPGKTIEGAIGHLAFACLGAWLCLTQLMPDDTVSVQWWDWPCYGLLVGTAGMIGDLAESLIKRDVGCKDSSTWLPGFGGVLDLVDSVLLAAPVGWFCWLILLGPK